MNTPHAPLGALAVALCVASLSGQVAVQPQTGPAPACAVSEDASYGYAKENPVQVGGSPMYGAARQRRYLDSLRGPDGQRVEYKRTGSLPASPGPMLDRYELKYEGVAEPIVLFLDWYHYTPPKAPRGFTCGQPFNLGLPPVDPFKESDALRALAAEQGAAREFAPIPLDAEGTGTYGVIFDRFRLLARGARAGAPPAATLPAAAGSPQGNRPAGTVVVAYALTCEGRTVKPSAVDLVSTDGAVMPPNLWQRPTAEEAARLLPGFTIPAGALAVATQVTLPRPNDTFRITYEGKACGASSEIVSLPARTTRGRAVDTPPATPPAGATALAPVFLQGIVDLEGAIRRIEYIGGPPALVDAAKEAAGRWRFEPMRVNGAPVVTSTVMPVNFEEPRR